MSELEERARAVVEAGRRADLPSPADRDRIKRAVLLQIAATGAVTSTATAATLSFGAKAGLAVLAVSLVGGGAVGVLALRHDGGATARPRVAPAARTVSPPKLAPAPPAEDLPRELPGPVPPEESAKRVERPRKAVSNGKGEVVSDPDQLNAEVAVLKRAREELRQGRPGRALDALVEYDRRFGNGVLGEERRAMAALAACQAEPGPVARAQAEAFLRQAPTSPLRERVREACITPARAPAP